MQFCFIDRVTGFVAGESATAYKNITANQEILDAHFPGYALFPGTQIIEAMAQLGGFLIELSLDKNTRGNRRAVLVKIEKAKFHQAVTPGDRLELTAQLLSELYFAREKLPSVKLTA